MLYSAPLTYPFLIFLVTRVGYNDVDAVVRGVLSTVSKPREFLMMPDTTLEERVGGRSLSCPVADLAFDLWRRSRTLLVPRRPLLIFVVAIGQWLFFESVLGLVGLL